MFALHGYYGYLPHDCPGLTSDKKAHKFDFVAHDWAWTDREPKHVGEERSACLLAVREMRCMSARNISFGLTSLPPLPEYPTGSSIAMFSAISGDKET